MAHTAWWNLTGSADHACFDKTAGFSDFAVVMTAGIAGGVPLAAAASHGITTPVLYNPYNDAGSRYTELADSQIQRLYHSNAFLLTSGQVSPGLQDKKYSFVSWTAGLAFPMSTEIIDTAMD